MRFLVDANLASCDARSAARERVSPMTTAVNAEFAMVLVADHGASAFRMTATYDRKMAWRTGAASAG